MPTLRFPKYRMQSSNREKRRFIIFGTLNVLITNILLQILILIFPTALATFFSQCINTFLGIYLYGKKVFKVQKINKFNIIKYLIFSFILWNLNWITIDILEGIVYSKNIAALIAMPMLATISYFSQRNIIFIR